jgi:hypothetical protein
MKAKNGTKTPKQRSDEFLEPLVRAADEYGAKEKLREAMEERTGEPVARERIERWLHRDPARRQQPLLGNGLLLMEVFEKINSKRKPRRKTT